MGEPDRKAFSMAAYSESAPLRERNRLERRRTIHLEGMRLFSVRGYEATTVAEVAEASGLAPRTVAMYYPAKLDIAMASTTEAAEGLLSAMKAAGPSDSLTGVVSEWLRLQSINADRELWELRAAMFAKNPSLGNADTPQQREVGRVSSELLARDLSVSIAHPAVALARGAISGILMSFVVASAHHDPEAIVQLASVALESVVNALHEESNGALKK